ncbi:MAG: hypothetical protein RIT02_480 [Planctomycetota bacterium]
MSSQHPVIIVGAGLAGLCCARELHRRNIPCLLLDAHDQPGGRVRTELVDGFRLDLGFQVLQTAYPEAQQQLDYNALQLRSFFPGALIRTGGRFVEMADPWRRPSRLFATLFNGIGSFADRLRLARLRWTVCTREDDSQPDSTTADFLRQTCGFTPDIIQRFFRPWFSGVFLEPALATSSRYFRFLFRTFALGDASLPSAGMGAIPQQLASTLPAGTLRLSTPVASVTRDFVHLTDGQVLSARAVVLAVDGPSAERLSQGILKSPAACSTVCLYFDAPKPPLTDPILVLNGDGQGPVNNLCVVSNVVPEYAPPGRSLISVSVVGLPAATDGLEQSVRRQLTDWFGDQVSSWRLLRTHRIPWALPAQPAGFRDQPPGHPATVSGLWYCGDYQQTASIHGAMLSGRRTATAVAAALTDTR